MASGDPVAIAQLQQQMPASGLLGYVGILVVIGFGILKSKDGPNQYGAEPVRF